jgi:hypothetical protein
MKIAVLCPGPSLAVSWGGGRQAYDCRIAVNRAIMHHPCEWWSAGDWPMLQDVDGRPSVGICSQDDAVRLARGGSLIPQTRMPKQFVSWSELPQKNPGYSMIAAIALAVHLGGVQIDVYGDDKHGAKDWDGQVAGKNRGDARWAKESLVMANTIAMLTAQRPLSITHIRIADDS